MGSMDMELERRAREAIRTTDEEQKPARRRFFDRKSGFLTSVYSDPQPEPMAITGWFPRRGMIPVFGKAGIMKTFVAVDVITHQAAVGPNRPDMWHGQAAIVRHGCSVIYSVEDTYERLDKRIWANIVNDLGMEPHSPEAIQTRSRILVIAPMSISPTDFGHPTPQLFDFHRESGKWVPNGNTNDLFSDIEAWNEGLGPDHEDRIVTLVLDSITTTAGFDLTDNQGATAYSWAFNARATQGDFMIIAIAHSVKSANPDKDDPEKGASDRLAGGFAWGAYTRASIEVRVPLKRGVTRKGSKAEEDAWWESFGLSAEHTNAIVMTVAKTNLDGMSKDKLWLDPRPNGKGAFRDVTEKMKGFPRRLIDFLTWTAQHDEVTGAVQKSQAPTVDRSKARALVLEVARWLASQGKDITANAIQNHQSDTRWAKNYAAVMIGGYAKGALVNNGTRGGVEGQGSAKWHLTAMADEGMFIRKGFKFEFTTGDPWQDDGSNGDMEDGQ